MEIVKVLDNGRGIIKYAYSAQDESLITTNLVNGKFNPNTDHVEFYIYDENDSILYTNYSFIDYKVLPNYKIVNDDYSAVSLDPEMNVKSVGYDRGTVFAQYNFFRYLFNSSLSKRYWIKEISNSRTELRLASQTISDESIRLGLLQYQSYFSNKNYYPEFLLNFGNNDQIIGVNAAFVEQDDQGYLMVKLYEPLPVDYDLKQELWIVDKIAESVSYQVNISIESIVIDTSNYLRGPNFNIRTFERVGQNTPYYTYDNLFSSPISSSIQQLKSYYEDKAISINVDYTNFSNFIHFSSAVERINNFVYKLQLIESYTAEIASQNSSTAAASIINSNVKILESNINRIIEKFDTYEYFLYYDSGSYSWPKSTSQKPYLLYSVNSIQATNWLGDIDTPGTILYDANYYDINNKDILRGTIPQYIQDDANNAPYTTFVDMIGQHFDNIWIYYKDVSNRYNATNNPFTGISLDTVADALRAFGVSLYTNTNISNEIYYSLFGVSQIGSLLPPTGSEGSPTYPISIVTSSIDTLPYSQIEKEIYKRLYHNLPYLLKTKGTSRCIKALISCFGIPESILTVNEFGGYDRLTRSGIFELYNDKIDIINQTLELSESVLSPYSTLQYFDNDNRLNSTTIEVGFSPSDKINENISSSLGYFDIDNLIGNPQHQYLPNYPDLDSQRDAYFSSYTQNKSIWEYIRLLKFYNNSLFKIIKDFVPARSNISTGIIIKPHVLERNKYARHEPSSSFHMMSQSIDILDLSATHANWYLDPNQITKTISSSLGIITVTNSYEYEKYTGEFEGTEFKVRPKSSFDQRDNSAVKNFIAQPLIRPNANELVVAISSPEIQDYTAQGAVISDINAGRTYWTNDFSASISKYLYEHILQDTPGFGQYSVLYGANFQNVLQSKRSTIFFDLDYSSNQNTPVNIDVISSSIQRSLTDHYGATIDLDVPYATVQDFNYNSNRSTRLRYIGSKAESLLYNNYTPPSDTWKGDLSYGNSPAIDHRTSKIALFTQIETSSFLPGKVNVALGYLVDRSSGLYELNLLNNNWFEVQNIYKAGKTLTIKQFDNKKYGNQKPTDGIKYIVESGYSYSPLLYFASGSDTKIYFNYLEPPDANVIATNNPAGIGNRFIAGDPSPFYAPIPTGQGQTGSIFNIFNFQIEDLADSYEPGNPATSTFPKYLSVYNGNYKVKINTTIDYKIDDDTDKATYQFIIKRNGVPVNSKIVSIYKGSAGNIPDGLDVTYSNKLNWKITQYGSCEYVPANNRYYYSFGYKVEYLGPGRIASPSAPNYYFGTDATVLVNDSIIVTITPYYKLGTITMNTFPYQFTITDPVAYYDGFITPGNYSTDGRTQASWSGLPGVQASGNPRLTTATSNIKVTFYAGIPQQKTYVSFVNYNFYGLTLYGPPGFWQPYGLTGNSWYGSVILPNANFSANAQTA